jgi:hypothetical protein
VCSAPCWRTSAATQCLVDCGKRRCWVWQPAVAPARTVGTNVKRRAVRFHIRRSPAQETPPRGGVCFSARRRLLLLSRDSEVACTRGCRINASGRRCARQLGGSVARSLHESPRGSSAPNSALRAMSRPLAQGRCAMRQPRVEAALPWWLTARTTLVRRSHDRPPRLPPESLAPGPKSWRADGCVRSVSRWKRCETPGWPSPSPVPSPNVAKAGYGGGGRRPRRRRRHFRAPQRRRNVPHRRCATRR